jgi:hypothetical protein
VHYPRSTGEFQAWFRTDEDCLDYLESLAGRFHLPALRTRHGLAAWRWPLGMRRVQFADLGDGGHDLRS